MKKSLLAIGLTALLFGGCKKEEVEEFLATDMTGTAVLSGTITKTIISQSTGGGFTQIMVPASGVAISVRIQNSQLYPNSPNAQGSEVYAATTDASGNYSINVKTNGNGNVSGAITITDEPGTLDTLRNGTTVTGPSANYSGTSTNRTFIKNVSQVFNYNMPYTVLVSNPNQIIIGTAIVTGTVQISQMEEDTTALGVYFYAPKYYNLANHTVTLEFDKDPVTQMKRTYTTTSNSLGIYTFTVQTTNDLGFSNNAVVKIADYAATRDTMRLDGTTDTGAPGVFENNSINVNGLNPTEIRNHQDIQYWNFN